MLAILNLSKKRIFVFLVEAMISGFSSLSSTIAVFLLPYDRYAENTAIAGKIEKKPENLTS